MKNLIILTLIITLFSCTGLDSKKLDLKIIEDENVKIEFYKISEISNIHEFVDITNKRWNKTERILEGESEQIDTILIKNDSVIIKISANPIIYDLAAIKFRYKIKLQTATAN